MNWIWIVPAEAFAFVLLLFPAGLLPSRRWRLAAWFVAAVYAVDTMGFVARASRVWRDPFAQSQGWYPGLRSALVVRRQAPVPALARWLPGLGIAATLAANVAPGLGRHRRGGVAGGRAGRLL